ncbi:MAG TPA: hypothetical protein VFU74_15115 [Actinocrinis sp.]|nr:hypothetical protein [Actinocrinis sp.]
MFDLSHTGVDEQHRLLFRRLGLVPGPDADAYAAAALLERDPNAATELLEDPVDHNLLIAHPPGHYRLHDLIRAHARSLADRHGREAALDRPLRYYAHTPSSPRSPSRATRGPRRAHLPRCTAPPCPTPGPPAPGCAPTAPSPAPRTCTKPPTTPRNAGATRPLGPPQ